MSASGGALPVLGMHRSGTSAVTRLLGLAGATLLPEASPGRTVNDANPTGFWEVQPLTDFNEEVLRALGGRWSAPPSLTDGWPSDSRLGPLRTQQRSLARRYLSEPGVVWKDPRLCLTLPFWADSIPPTAPAVVVVRNPIEIAASLEARSRFDPELSFALWERYMRSALSVADNRRVLVVSYEEVLSTATAVVATMRSWCEQAGVPLGAPGEHQSIAGFVTAELRHSRFDDSDVADHPVMTAAQKALYSTLHELVGDHSRFSAPDLPLPPSGDELLEARRLTRWTPPDRWDRRMWRAMRRRGSLIARRRRHRS